MGASQSTEETVEDLSATPEESKENINPTTNNTNDNAENDSAEKSIVDSDKKDDNTKHQTSCPQDDCKSTEQNIYPPIETRDQLRSMFKSPEEFRDFEHFLKHWDSWKIQFESYLKFLQNSYNYNRWSSFLFNRLGPVGYDIFSNLVFNHDKEDILVLVMKFETFYKYYLDTKAKNECIKDYIERLKRDDIEEFNIVENMIQQKIKCFENIRTCICSKCQSSSELTLDCSFCGSSHINRRTSCPARMNLCTICKNTGHYAIKCSKYEDKK